MKNRRLIVKIIIFIVLNTVIIIKLEKDVNIMEGENMEKKFACAINCMDGRIQRPIEEYIQKNYGINYVDMVTEPGPNGILAQNTDISVIENIKKRVGVSVNYHDSKIVAIVGHFGCAGNPNEKEDQIQHLIKAEKIVESFGFNVKIILLWVNDDWKTVDKIEISQSEFTNSQESDENETALLEK